MGISDADNLGELHLAQAVHFSALSQLQIGHFHVAMKSSCKSCFGKLYNNFYLCTMVISGDMLYSPCSVFSMQAFVVSSVNQQQFCRRIPRWAA